MSKLLGWFQIEPNEGLTITDPGYDKDVWCRVNDLKFKPGYYKVYYDVKDCRPSRLLIVHKDYLKEYRKQDVAVVIDCVGVDSGLCGFFIDKPDYDYIEWGAVCEHLLRINDLGIVHKNTPFKCKGIVCRSGYGDGEYSAKLKVNTEGEFYSCEVRFI